MAFAGFPKVKSWTGDVTDGYGIVASTLVSTILHPACDEAEPFGFVAATSGIWV
jgi:hypothetical protein